MANPLQILGDIGGGLSTIGAQGAGGAYEGVLEGEALKRRFSASDADTNLRILQGLLMQQQLGPQYHTDPQGRTFLVRPGQPPQFTGFAPQRPPTDLEKAHTDYYRAAAEGKLLGPADKAEKAPTKASVEGQILSEYVSRLMTQGPQAAQQWLKDAYAPIRQAESVPGAHQPVLGSPEHPRIVELPPTYGADGKLHRYQLRTVTDKDGNTETKKVDLGVAPDPASARAGGLTPRETVTTSTKITPRKLLTDQETLTLNASMPQIINDLSAKPGFNVPGSWVTLPNGMRERKEDLIAKYVKARLGVEVSVQWDGKQFKVVKAWNPAVKEPIETRRTTGPPSAREPEDTEDEQ